MFSSAAVFYANATEQLYTSSLDESIWNSPVYYPPIETSSGVYYYNYLQEYCYGPVYYGYQYYQVYYPVAYSADYYNLVYYEPAYSGYYMPVYYVPSYLYYVSDMYPGPVDESSVACSSAEEFDSDLYYTAMGFSEKSCEFLTDGIGEVNTTCYLYYEEGPKKLNDDPSDDEENSDSSNNIVKNDAVTNTPDKDESRAVKPDDGVQSSTVNKNPCEEDEYKKFIDSLSAADMMELKAEIDGRYNHLKKNLYNDVIRGYANMKEFLKNIKWKWDRLLPTIREEEKYKEIKETFDMEQYYFHDVIRIPKGRVRYEDPAEKYILYQMLGSLQMDDLKRFMELNYDNGKKRLYKKECIGFFKIKKQLKKLNWEPSSLCRITDGKELKISKNAFVRHFIRGLRNITSEDSEDVNYLLDVLKKSVLTSADMSDEDVEEEFNEEVTALDSELMMEHRQVSVFSSEKLENDVPNTADMSISKQEHDVENEKIIEELQLIESTSCVAECSKNDPVPGEIELSLCKEDSGTQKVEDIQTFTPSEKKIEENEGPFASPVIEMDSVSYGKEDSSPVSMERIEEPLPDMPSSESVEENIIHAPPVSMERIEEPLPDVPSSESVEEKIIHAPPVSMERIEEPLSDVPSSEGVEKKIIHGPPVSMPEPTVLPAAADKCHHKKRFSSLRKFLSRICCCRKKPPS